MEVNVIHETLGKLKDFFPMIAAELAEAMFNVHDVTYKPWELSDHFEGQFDYIFSLGSSNDKFQGTTVIGMNLQDMPAFFGTKLEWADALDVLGEFANVFCAMMMDEPQFTNTFGFMRQKPPQDALNLAFFPKAWGVHGRISIQESSLYIAHFIDRKKFDFDQDLAALSKLNSTF